MGRFVTCGAQLVGCRKRWQKYVEVITNWQDGIYSSGNESWRRDGILRGVFWSAMPTLRLAIGCFHPTATDSPFQPGQLVKKMAVLFSFPQRSLSATDLFNCKEMFSSAPGTPVQGWNCTYPSFSYSLSLCSSFSIQYKLFSPCLIQQ